MSLHDSTAAFALDATRVEGRAVLLCLLSAFARVDEPCVDCLGGYASFLSKSLHCMHVVCLGLK